MPIGQAARSSEGDSNTTVKFVSDMKISQIDGPAHIGALMDGHEADLDGQPLRAGDVDRGAVREF